MAMPRRRYGEDEFLPDASAALAPGAGEAEVPFDQSGMSEPPPEETPSGMPSMIADAGMGNAMGASPEESMEFPGSTDELPDDELALMSEEDPAEAGASELETMLGDPTTAPLVQQQLALAARRRMAGL